MYLNPAASGTLHVNCRPGSNGSDVDTACVEEDDGIGLTMMVVLAATAEVVTIM